jgi:MFS family permease
MGALSDRVGRKVPMVGGMAALAAATLLFAVATTLPWLFAARLMQGAADAITWVVGFALIADRYDARERGRVTGYVMMGTSAAFMLGPTLGGWLYEIGGMRLPFVSVAAMACAAVALFWWLDVPPPQDGTPVVRIGAVLRLPAVAICAVAVIAIAATVSMLEPVLSMHLGFLGVDPARIGTIYGVAAVVTTALHPLAGRLADRVGARQLTMAGLLATSAATVFVGRAASFGSAVALYVLVAAAAAFVITPSLAFMAEATSEAPGQSFGVAYGLYNLAWGAGMLGGPALGGVLFQRFGFARLALGWAPAIALVTIVLARARPNAVSRRSVRARADVQDL